MFITRYHHIIKIYLLKNEFRQSKDKYERCQPPKN